MKHTESLSSLHSKLSKIGCILEQKKIDHGHQFIISGGAIVNWFPKTGKLLFHGDGYEAVKLEEKFRGLISDGIDEQQSTSADSAAAVAWVENQNQPIKYEFREFFSSKRPNTNDLENFQYEGWEMICTTWDADIVTENTWVTYLKKVVQK